MRDVPSDAILTDEAELVVIGYVESETFLRHADDPLLPQGWEDDPHLKELVEEGAGHTKWVFQGEQFVKGSAPTPLIVEIGGSGTPAESYGGQVEPVGSEDLDLDPGGRYKIWLMSDPWYQQNHWILQHSHRLS